MRIRDFDEEERKDITTFLLANLEQSELNKLIIYKEDLIEKAEVFINIWGVMSASSQFLRKQETKNKLLKFLKETKEVYYLILPLANELKNAKIEYGKSQIKRKISNLMLDKDYCENINHLRDAFVTLAQREDIIAMADVIAVNLMTPEGKNLEKEINPDQFRT